jgi:predicted nucleic acid-binding protein
VIAVDTSVVVAAFASWHEAHASAREALSKRPRLLAHVALESYSVLTRLPPPHRVAPRLVGELLEAYFPEPAVTLPGRDQASLLKLAIEAGVTGGAIYDALVAATAKHAGATLLTRDLRAIPVYDVVGAEYELLVQ